MSNFLNQIFNTYSDEGIKFDNPSELLETYDDVYLRQVERVKKLLELIKLISNHLRGSEVKSIEKLIPLIYLNRLIGHLESVLVLRESNDLFLIARTIFEGFAYFFNNINDPNDSQKIANYICAGIYTHAKNQENSDELLLLLQSHFEPLMQRGEVCLPLFEKNGKFPLKHNSESLKSICEKNSMDKIYEFIYSPLSNYHHWGAESLVHEILKLEFGNEFEQIDIIKKTLRCRSFDITISCAISYSETLIDFFEIKNSEINDIFKECFEDFLSEEFSSNFVGKTKVS